MVSCAGVKNWTTFSEAHAHLRQTLFAVALRDAVGQRRTEGAVRVHDVALDADRQALLEGRLALVDKLVVQSDVELVVCMVAQIPSHRGGVHASRTLLPRLVRRDTRSHLPRRLEDGAEIEIRSLGVAKRLVHLEQVGPPDHLVDGAEAELGHDGAELLDDILYAVLAPYKQVREAAHEEEVDDVLGLAGKLGPQLGILRRNADGTL